MIMKVPDTQFTTNYLVEERETVEDDPSSWTIIFGKITINKWAKVLLLVVEKGQSRRRKEKKKKS